MLAHSLTRSLSYFSCIYCFGLSFTYDDDEYIDVHVIVYFAIMKEKNAKLVCCTDEY